MKDIFVEVDWMKEPDGKEYGFSEEAQNKVIKAFGNHEIILHIDDGCMGGGGNLDDTYYRYSTSYTHRGTYDDYNDFFDYKHNFFDSTNRNGIFHYCLIAHYKYDIDSGSVQKNKGGTTYLGYTSDFAIWGEGSSDYAKSFQHELGHNLLGNKHDATHNGGIYLDDKGHHNIKSCIMESSSKGSDYCSRCWSELNLAKSLS